MTEIAAQGFANMAAKWQDLRERTLVSLTSDHSPVIQMNSQGCVLQGSISAGFIWLLQNFSWTSESSSSKHNTARALWPVSHVLLH